MKLLITIALFAGVGYSQTPPSQPTSGPNGSDYTYTCVTSYGLYYVTPQQPSTAQSYYVYQPSCGPSRGSFPVVLFLHGYGGDNPQAYLGWINHMVQKGYSLVYPVYDANVNDASQFAVNILACWQSALALLQSNGFFPPSTDSRGMQTVFAGHSMGGYQSLAISQSLSQSPMEGIPMPRAVAVFEPEIGSAPLSLDMSSFPNIPLVMVDGDEDPYAVEHDTTMWNSMTTPLTYRDFLEVISDSHGSPAQLGIHMYPVANPEDTGWDPNSTIDNRDYNVTYKLSAGIFNCALLGTGCSYGLGHGDSNQVNMGVWSDGVPVTPLQFNAGGK